MFPFQMSQNIVFLGRCWGVFETSIWTWKHGSCRWMNNAWDCSVPQYQPNIFNPGQCIGQKLPTICEPQRQPGSKLFKYLASLHCRAHLMGINPQFLKTPRKALWVELIIRDLGGKPQKVAPIFLRTHDKFKKYILQKNWTETVNPALSSGQHNLHPAIWGSHRQLDDHHRNPNTNTEII